MSLSLDDGMPDLCGAAEPEGDLANYASSGRVVTRIG